MNIYNDIVMPDTKKEQYYNKCRDEMVELIPRNVEKLLDVGCGTGNFGRSLKLKRNNIEVWGIEISEKAAEIAKEKLNKVIMGDIEVEDIALPDDYFDCIVFNDVLEHLKYPWTVLKKIRHYLKDDAYIVASIPNVRFFYNIKDLLRYKEWKYVDDGILDKTHLRFFTIKSIEDMFRSCNYRVLKIEGINSIEFPWKFRILNWVMMKKFEDMRFPQYSCVVQKIK